MNVIDKWWKEGKKVTPIHKAYNSEFLIYKGFKITLKDGVYSIQDVRFSNMYQELSDIVWLTFKVHGFVKGVDLIGLERDTKRIDYYKKSTETLYDKRAKFTKLLSKNRKLNEKRIRNINLKIDEYIDLMFFYQVRVQQLTLKYNKNE